jgi:hypothetical protein
MNKLIILGLVLAVLALSVKARNNSTSSESWSDENSQEMKNRNRDMICGYDKDKAIEGTQLRSVGKRKLADCCDACNADSSCFFFSYDKKNNNCFLWAQGSRVRSGRKDCKFSCYLLPITVRSYVFILFLLKQSSAP